MKNFRYILRYYIDPGFCENERITELTDFCRQSRIDEVMLFFNAEEMNTGHWQMEELEAWLPLAKKIKAALTDCAVELSLNPWTTLVHEARGRKLKSGQNYTLMVGDTGCDNGVTTCPLDENWLHDLCGLWQRVAAELQPVTLWIEDDFRLHNHGGIMGFGGCYCHKHLAEFSSLVGKDVTREELQQKIFAPGKAHPWRKIWLDMNARIMTDTARKLAAAVVGANPATGIGLMSGSFDAMAGEGRRLGELQKAMEVNQMMAIRPTMSPYTEVWAMRRAPVEARMTAAMLTPPFKLFPELESGPRHGAYSLGCGFAGWEIMESASFGSHGVTMNCFDMMGNGTVIDRNFGTMLAGIKPRLNALADLEINDRCASGAKVLISPEIAAYAPANVNKYNSYSGEWGRVATILGISHRFVDKIAPSEEPYLVSGNVLRTFSKDEIKTLLSQRVVLDAVAAADLIDMGFGELIGTDQAVRHATTATDCSFEEILEAEQSIYGVPFPRLTVQRAAWEVTEFTVNRDVRMLSLICSSAKKRLFAGAFEFVNSCGGKIATLAYDMGDRGKDEWFYFGFFSVFRRIFIQKILQELAPGSEGVYVNAPARCFGAVLSDGSRFAGVLNSTTDKLAGVEIRFTGEVSGVPKRLDMDGNWTDDGLTEKKVSGGIVLRLSGDLDIHGAEFFRFDKC